MTGRTLFKFSRVYFRGYDVSGYTRSYGPLVWENEPVDLTTLSDPVKGYLPGNCNVSVGNLNWVMDTDETDNNDGTYLFGGTTAAVQRYPSVTTIAIGDRAVPAIGDPTFNGYFQQLGYQSGEDGGAITTTIPMGPHSFMYPIEPWNYKRPWGNLLNPAIARTAVNTSGGFDSGIVGGTAFGGIAFIHVLSVTAVAGTFDIKVQHCATNNDGDFVDLAGCGIGVTAAHGAGYSDALATTLRTTQVDRYTRWQIVLGTATSVTFILSFVRGLSAGD